MSNAQPRLTTTARLGRRGLLGAGAAFLFVGWGSTALLTGSPGLAPADPAASIVAVWVLLFALIAAVALTQCPARVTFSRPVLTWVGLNVLALTATVAAVAGIVPVGLRQYAYWHAWVAGGVLGFAATGESLRRSGASGGIYYLAAVVEAWILVVGFVSFGTLVPGLYLLLALVHPTPLALDALDLDVDPWYQTVGQVALYTTVLLAVILG